MQVVLPDLNVRIILLIDIVDYNGDIYPGSTTEFILNIENLGNQSADHFTIKISPDQPMIEI